MLHKIISFPLIQDWIIKIVHDNLRNNFTQIYSEYFNMKFTIYTPEKGFSRLSLCINHIFCTKSTPDFDRSFHAINTNTGVIYRQSVMKTHPEDDEKN